jgi:hypothetical protein
VIRIEPSLRSRINRPVRITINKRRIERLVITSISPTSGEPTSDKTKSEESQSDTQLKILDIQVVLCISQVRWGNTKTVFCTFNLCADVTRAHVRCDVDDGRGLRVDAIIEDCSLKV